jgi:hypothetical protein
MEAHTKFDIQQAFVATNQDITKVMPPNTAIRLVAKATMARS